MKTPSPEDIKFVRDYEVQANKTKILSYNFSFGPSLFYSKFSFLQFRVGLLDFDPKMTLINSSGSTGPPKIQMFKNQVPLRFPQPPADNMRSGKSPRFLSQKSYFAKQKRPQKVLGMKNFFQMVGNVLTSGINYSMTGNFNGFIVVLSVLSGMMMSKVLSVWVNFSLSQE